MDIRYAIGNIQYDIPISDTYITVPIAEYNREGLINEIFREFELNFDPSTFSMEEWGELERSILQHTGEMLDYINNKISKSPEILENEDIVLYIVVRR